MNISPINTQQNYNRQNPTFKSGALLSSAFMEINKHEIIGVSAIDLLSMVIPRSVIDFTRNKEAGTETAIRESSSTATHASIGLSGMLAATLLALGLKKKNYNVDFKSINANSETVDGMAKVFKEILDKNPAMPKEDLQRTFLNRVFENVQGLAGNSANGDKKIWYSLNPANQIIQSETVNTKNSIIEILMNQQKTNKSFKLPSNVAGQLEAYMNMDIPSTRDLKITLSGKEIMTKGEEFLQDVHALTKAFTQDNVISGFKNQSDALKVEFIKDLKKLNVGKTALGLATICAVALSMQTINRHLTQKRTGKEGFVGDPDYEKKKANTPPQKSDNMFLAMKSLAVATMGFFIFKTINANSLKDLISKVQFKGNLPTMNQIKLVYGSTILGRLIAAHDKNELRESSFRDFLGYTNFLVLGSLVTKCFVNWKDKSLINYDEKSQGKGFWNWIKESSVKTHQEVVNSTLKTNVLEENGIKSLKELYKNNWIKPAGTIAQKLGVLNKAKLIGMAYSCIALGIFVPLINKHMTERKNKNNNVASAMVPEKKASTEQTQTIINDFLNKAS